MSGPCFLAGILVAAVGDSPHSTLVSTAVNQITSGRVANCDNSVRSSSRGEPVLVCLKLKSLRWLRLNLY